jgi:L-ribulose-5-phosphate 4-epimerase
MADEFGGDIPCGGFALIGGEEIGKVVVETLANSKSPAALLQNHGVFTIGANAEAAVKAAVMTEDVAATVWLALQLGQPLPIAAEDIAKLHHRYTNVYGQQVTE